MGMPNCLPPSIILPTAWTLGTETENIDDLLEHTSIEVDVEEMDQKMVQIVATEAVAAGVPGNLWAWIELSPYDSPVSAAYWAAIGGGGGAIAPVAPLIIAGTGVNGTVHTFMLPWQAHSAYARLVLQTPVAAALPTAFWVVQAVFSAKTV